MPTPMNVYTELAIKYGDIDEKDSSSILRFFEVDIYKLSSDVQKMIINELLARNAELPKHVLVQDIPEDEYVPLPNPADYIRADEARRRRRIKN